MYFVVYHKNKGRWVSREVYRIIDLSILFPSLCTAWQLFWKSTDYHKTWKQCHAARGPLTVKLYNYFPS
jgi:hypothetical protein